MIKYYAIKTRGGITTRVLNAGTRWQNEKLLPAMEGGVRPGGNNLVNAAHSETSPKVQCKLAILNLIVFWSVVLEVKHAAYMDLPPNHSF